MTNTVPGVLEPTMSPYPEGANSARTAGIVESNMATSKQIALLNTAHGGKRGRKVRRGGANEITVPTFQVMFKDVGTGSQTVNGNITSSTQIGATSAANSVYDVCAGQPASCTAAQMAKQSGGKRRTLKGGVKWGCYSGGKSKKTNKKSKKSNKKSKKSKKSRKSKRKH
jgi:hypothetical protein